MSKKDLLRQVDLCFVVDTTGSMGTFIRQAQTQLREALERLGADKDLDLQVALVEYRDFPPQDRSFVTRLYEFTGDLARMQTNIDKLSAGGGGDAPEAVYSGVHDACTKLVWREHGFRFALLVGDAPPHAYVPLTAKPGTRPAGGDGFPDGCPSGLDVRQVTAAAEEAGVTLHALCMHARGAAENAFTELAIGTGGQCVVTNANAVVDQIERLVAAEIAYLELDGQVLDIVETDPEIDVRSLAERLEVPRLQVAASLARLGRRRFLS